MWSFSLFHSERKNWDLTDSHLLWPQHSGTEFISGFHRYGFTWTNGGRKLCVPPIWLGSLTWNTESRPVRGHSCRSMWYFSPLMGFCWYRFLSFEYPFNLNYITTIITYRHGVSCVVMPMQGVKWFPLNPLLYFPAGSSQPLLMSWVGLLDPAGSCFWIFLTLIPSCFLTFWSLLPEPSVPRPCQNFCCKF